ncbi:MAG: imelysin family protein [Pontibacterium sp.]
MEFRTALPGLAVSVLLLTGCADPVQKTQAAVSPEKAVLNHYADIGLATYEDTLYTARSLQDTIRHLLDNPTEANLQAAKTAWKAARVPYQQSEVFRFGNSIVDDWEGRVNAWPLDEGLIDYVATNYGNSSDENAFYTLNVIANPVLSVGGVEVNARQINKQLLAETLHEIDDVEANVATGYHAIEFLLWGQDLNGTEPGAGRRPATDFNLMQCTGGHCDRRRDYLSAATELLIDDLQAMVENWKTDGRARADLAAKGNLGGLSTMLTGMGSLAYGELAGERIKLGLMLHDPEEEHDCFSDNTHWSHFYDAKGIQNVYLGEYHRVDGSRLKGPSLSTLVQQIDPASDRRLRARLDATQIAMQQMVNAAQAGSSFDVLIAENNTAGNQIVQHVVDALSAETQAIENVITLLKLDGIELEGSDSLDNPAAVLTN